MVKQKTGKILVVKPFYNAWPVGFAYVLACLEEHNIPFDFIDASRSQNLRKELRLLMSNNSYIAIASGGLIGFFKFFKEIAQMVHRYQAGIPFILGGNITKDASNDLLFEYIGMNFGILGEAETSLPELIKSIIDKDFNALSSLPGIAYKNADGTIARNLPHRLDLHKINILPAWHNFDVDYYTKAYIPLIGNDISFMPVLTGRGCVGKCTFCSPSIGGFRKRPIEHVMFEIEYITSKYNFDNILFYNEMFYPTANEIRDFCNQYMLLKNKKPWITQVRVDSNIDVTTFNQMKEAGCIVVSAGIESGSDKVLSLMNKKITSEQIRIFFRNAKLANMPTNGTFIVGSEGETEEDIKKTIDLVIDEEINTYASLMYVYPGTVAYDNALKKGLIKSEMEHLNKAIITSLLDRMVGGPPSLFGRDSKEHFLNISNIPDKEFFHTATREERRYNTFVFKRYPVQDLSYKLEMQGKVALMILSGKCHECGSDVKYEYDVFRRAEYLGILGGGVTIDLICPKCFRQLSFNLYLCKEMRELREHFSFLKEKLSKMDRIILGGINRDTSFMLRINLFDIDYEKILGFVDFARKYWYKYYVNYSIFHIDDIVDLNPDCILMMDSTSNGEAIIREAYDRRKRPPPEFLYLLDKGMLDTLKEIKSKSNSRYNQSALWLQNRYTYWADYCDKKDIGVPELLPDLAQHFWKKLSNAPH